MSACHLPNPMPKANTSRLPEGKRTYETNGTASRPMAKSKLSRRRDPPWLAALILLGTVGAMSACSGEPHAEQSVNASSDSKTELINPGSVRGLNYSSGYIHSFTVTGPRGMNGGGPNISPARQSGPSGGAAGKCCIGIPQPWVPDTKLEIGWELDRSPYDNDIQNGLEVMRATVTVPEYGPSTYGLWVIFLSGDRVKVLVMDGNANGHNSVRTKPTDKDPFVVKGVRDDAQTKELQERYR